MIIEIKVKSRARQNSIEPLSGNTKNAYLVHTTKPAARGQANETVIKIVAEYFNTSRSCVRIKAGHTSKIKILEII